MVLWSFENILESIIGPVEDEFDDEQPEIISEGPKQYNISGKTSIKDINQRFGLKLKAIDADTITGLKKDGATIILVEHNLRLGLSIADKVYVLENGKIAFQANSTDLSGVEYAKKIYLGG